MDLRSDFEAMIIHQLHVLLTLSALLFEGIQYARNVMIPYFKDHIIHITRAIMCPINVITTLLKLNPNKCTTIDPYLFDYCIHSPLHKRWSLTTSLAIWNCGDHFVVQFSIMLLDVMSSVLLIPVGSA